MSALVAQCVHKIDACIRITTMAADLNSLRDRVSEQLWLLSDKGQPVPQPANIDPPNINPIQKNLQRKHNTRYISTDRGDTPHARQIKTRCTMYLAARRIVKSQQQLDLHAQ